MMVYLGQTCDHFFFSQNGIQVIKYRTHNYFECIIIALFARYIKSCTANN